MNAASLHRHLSASAITQQHDTTQSTRNSKTLIGTRSSGDNHHSIALPPSYSNWMSDPKLCEWADPVFANEVNGTKLIYREILVHNLAI